MKLKKKFLIWWLLFLIVIGSCCFFLFSQNFLHIFQSFKPPTITQKEIAQKNLENVLTQWIYNHSNRISKQSANLIAKEVVKTSKPLLILALIEIESEFNSTAISSKGAIGLTQIMFNIHGKDLIKKEIIKEKRDLFNIVPSIWAGDYVLNICLTQSNGDVPKALERYLGGKDGAYIHRILSNLANLYILTHSLEVS